MLVNLAAILAPAVGRDYSVACFNVFGWEEAQAVVGAAAALGAGDPRRERRLPQADPIEVIAPLLRAAALQAPVPVCVHLDHARDIPECMRAVDAGFTSVMYDGSQLPLEENIAGTRQVAAYAHAAGCSSRVKSARFPSRKAVRTSRRS